MSTTMTQKMIWDFGAPVSASPLINGELPMNNHFQAKAATKERVFLRKYGKEGYTFFTVKEHRPNIIHKVTKDYIYVTTEKSKRPNRIPRSSLRRALAI